MTYSHRLPRTKVAVAKYVDVCKRLNDIMDRPSDQTEDFDKQVESLFSEEDSIIEEARRAFYDDTNGRNDLQECMRVKITFLCRAVTSENEREMRASNR